MQRKTSYGDLAVQLTAQTIRFIFFFLFSMSLHLPASAQQGVLEKRVSLQLKQVPLEEALHRIEDEAEVFFSYYSTQIDTKRKVNIDVQNKTLGSILYDLLGLQPDQLQINGQQITLRNQGNNSRIHGQVLTLDGKPAPYTSISIYNGKKTVANANGFYQLDNVAPGKQVIIASFVGGASQRRELWLQEGSINTQDFSLDASAQQLHEVLVVGNKYTISSKKESESVARMPLANLENPQVYSVIDKELIKEQMAITLDESFRNVPGAAPSKTGAGMPSFFSRGFQTSENFRNGMATYLRTGIDLANVERVEAIKGPSSTLFGAQMTSFGGIINYVTKKPYDHFGGEVSYTLGSWDLNRLTADINTPLGDSKEVLFRFNAARQQENTFQRQGSNATTLLAPSISYQVNDRLQLLVDADFLSAKGVTPAGWFISNSLTATSFNEMNLSYRESLNDNSLVSQQQSSNILTQINYKISDEWTSETKYAWGGGSYDDMYIFDMIWRTVDSVDRILRTFTDEKTARQNFQQNFKGDFKIAGLRNRLVGGFDFVSNYRNTRYDGLGYAPQGLVFESVDLNHLAAAPAIRIEEVQRILANRNTGFNQTKQATYGAYLSNVLNLSDQLSLSLGLRFDRFVNKGTYNTQSRTNTGDYAQNTLSPRFGIVYQIVPEKISLFGNYLNGFKNVGNQIQPNQTVSVFKPQRANQVEGGVKMALGNALNATLSYYRIHVTNSVMNRLVDNMNFYFQEGEQKSEGFEAEFIGNPFLGFNYVASYGYNNNRYVKANANVEGKRALGTPEHVLNLWASYALVNTQLKGLGLGVGHSYISDAYLDASNLFTLKGYHLLDATLFYNRPKYRLSVKANNILDQQYWISDSYYARPQKPANFLASITYRF